MDEDYLYIFSRCLGKELFEHGHRTGIGSVVGPVASFNWVDIPAFILAAISFDRYTFVEEEISYAVVGVAEEWQYAVGKGELFIGYDCVADIGIVEVWEVLVLGVARGESEGSYVYVLNDNARPGVVFAVEKVAGVLSVEETPVHAKVVAVGVEDRVENSGVVMYPSARGAHNNDVGIDAAVEDVVPTGIVAYLSLTKFVGEV